MIRGVALPIALLATVMLTLAAGQSPENKSEEPEPFDIEPAILKQNLSDEPLPDGDVARLEKQFERAKRNAEGAERLYKIGVLAKVEVEQRLLKVVRYESDLANARVARAKDEVAAKESELAAGEITKDELEAVKTALATRYQIDGTRLTTTGYGESRPKDTNDTLEGRARIRRVELVRR